MNSNGFKSTGVPCVYQDLPWDELDDACRLGLRRDGQTPERWEQRRKTHPFFVKFTAEKKSYWAWFPTMPRVRRGWRRFAKGVARRLPSSEAGNDRDGR